MTGKAIRLNRLFTNEKIVTVAVDHGSQLGPLPGIIDLPKTIHNIKKADGVLLNPGMVEPCQAFFSAKDSPMMIMRITWTTSYCFPWEYKTGNSCMMITPQEALSMGADIVCASCILKSGEEAADNRNVEIFSRLAQEKEKAGIPLLGEFYPLGATELSPDELHNSTYISARVIAELGGDIIKCFYTGRKFADIVKAVPIPILVLGAEKLDSEIKALDLAYRAVNDGASGIIFGRNVFQAKHPGLFLEAVKEVVQNGTKPETAAKNYGLK